MKDDPDFVPPNENDPIIMEPNNKYAQAIYYRDDLMFQVNKFGYKPTDIWQSIMDNLATH